MKQCSSNTCNTDSNRMINLSVQASSNRQELCNGRQQHLTQLLTAGSTQCSSYAPVKTLFVSSSNGADGTP
jgi:hypothetical protein